MKNIKNAIFFVLLLNSINAIGQSDYEKAYFSQSYKDTFKHVSVAIARMMEEYTYTNNGMNDYKINVVFRAQYILKDISALNSFSTLYKLKDLKKYDLKQIKPNGKVNVIYEYFDKNYPDDGYDKSKEKEDDKKDKKNEEIPLEDLEIGDIIDYRYEYTYTSKTKPQRTVIVKNGKFDKVPRDVPNRNTYKYLFFKNKFIEDSYPMVSGTLVFHVPDELELLQKSFNCDFKFTSKKNGGVKTYECLLNDVKPFKSEEFSYYYLEHPVVKYSLIQTNTAKKLYYPYQFSSANVDKDEIVALGRRFYADKKFLSNYLYYLNTQYESDPFKEVSLDKFFSSFLKTFTKKDKDKYSKLNKMHEYLTNEDELNEKTFGDMSYAVILSRFCDKLGIKYDMMACLNRYDGNWSDIVSPYEITWGLFIPRKEGDLYISSYSKESNIYKRYGSLSGTDLILFDPKSKEVTYKIEKYPEVNSNENQFIQNSEILLSSDKEFEYVFTNNYQIKGQQKLAISDYIKSQFDYTRLRTPSRFYGLLNYGDLYNWKEFSSNEEWFEEARRIDSSYRLYFKNYYNMKMTQFLYSEYEFYDIEVDSCRIYEEGDFPDDESKDYGFKVVFKVSGLLDKCSNDSMKVLNLGRLITSQYQISDYKVNERHANVYNSNLKEIKWQNSIELPDSFESINLDDFNSNFENEAGAFKSSAKLENGKIIMTVEKIYKTHYLPREKWIEMVNFLQFADRYSMQKLLLKRK